MRHLLIGFFMIMVALAVTYGCADFFEHRASYLQGRSP